MCNEEEVLKVPVCPLEGVTQELALVDTNRYDFVTISQFIHDKSADSRVSIEFTELLLSIQEGIKIISSVVKLQGLGQMCVLDFNKHESWDKNTTYFSKMFVEVIADSYAACLIAGNEFKSPLKVDPERCGRYMVVFNAIVGPKNMDASSGIGSVFGIYECPDDVNPPDVTLDSILLSGRDMKAAGYAVYNTNTVLYLTLGKNTGVHGFVLDMLIGEFMLTDYNVKIPPNSNHYSINEGHIYSFNKNLIDWLDQKKMVFQHERSMSRYTSSILADFHRTLKLGGIFLYPENAVHPKGKHKLVFEVIPLSLMMTEAGGKATDGKGDLLDVVPTSLHQQTPVYLGGPQQMDTLMDFLRRPQK